MDTGHIKSSIENAVDYLRRNPSAARSKDSTALAVLEEGLRCRAEGPNGAVLITDMPAVVGGGGSAPGPGWYLRAALATCDATMIAMRCATQGVTLRKLEVTVDSDSDDRGLFGADETTSGGPLLVRVHIRAESDASADQFRRIVDWVDRHSPVGDAIRRAIPMSISIEQSWPNAHERQA